MVVGVSRLRSCGAVALALALTACSSGPGEDDAAPRKMRPTTTTTAIGAIEPSDDGGLVGSQPGDAPSSSPTTAPGKPAVRTGSGSNPASPPGGSTSTSTTTTSGAGTTTTLPPGLPPEKCPEPKTCRYYTFTGGSPTRWPAGADGRVTIEYWINPAAAKDISVEDIEGAVAAAFATWQRAAPTLRFVYRGRTDRLAVPGDGVSVVDFNGGVGFPANTSVRGGPFEFDMQFKPGGWVWAPCEQRDGACTPYRETRSKVGPTEASAVDLQGVATHEAGHALWLHHPPGDPAYTELTMTGTSGYDRKPSTLALGDVLGVRALYPCSCPLPPIYDP